MNYNNSKIYSIRSNQTDKIYIGSTTQSLSKRFSKHNCDYKSYLLGKYHYVTSFEICKYDDSYIELIEEFSCNNVEQLCKREGELIRSYNCVNKCIAGRSVKEYYEDNKDKIIQNNQIYNKNNIDKHNKSSKKYRETHKNIINEKHICECGGKYTTSCKSNHIKTAKHQKFFSLIN